MNTPSSAPRGILAAAALSLAVAGCQNVTTETNIDGVANPTSMDQLEYYDCMDLVDASATQIRTGEDGDGNAQEDLTVEVVLKVREGCENVVVGVDGALSALNGEDLADIGGSTSLSVGEDVVDTTVNLYDVTRDGVALIDEEFTITSKLPYAPSAGLTYNAAPFYTYYSDFDENGEPIDLKYYGWTLAGGHIGNCEPTDDPDVKNCDVDDFTTGTVSTAE